MPDDRQTLTRADLPEEQGAFDAVLHQVMSETAGRVRGQISRRDWPAVLRDASGRGARRPGSGPPSRVDEHLSRMAQRIDRQVDVAEALAPDVDWSFAQPAGTLPEATQAPDTSGSTDTTDGDSETVHDLEERLTEQVEPVQVMSEIAEVSERTYALEKQRDLQTTRGIFFGFVVSVAVLVAGWAPLVAADDWAERIWILGLTILTCIAAGLVYSLIRRWQNRHQAEADDQGETV